MMSRYVGFFPSRFFPAIPTFIDFTSKGKMDWRGERGGEIPENKTNKTVMKGKLNEIYYLRLQLREEQEHEERNSTQTHLYAFKVSLCFNELWTGYAWRFQSVYVPVCVYICMSVCVCICTCMI